MKKKSINQKEINFLYDNLLNKPVAGFEKFHSKTKIKSLNSNLSDPEEWPIEWKTVYFKTYPRMDRFILPPPSGLGKAFLEKTLYERTSNRDFDQKTLDLETLSNFLFFTAGQRRSTPPWQGNRFYPSAGARYPLEIYLISLNSELEKDIYHYNVISHSLERLLSITPIKLEDYVDQAWVKEAGIVVVVTAIFYRNTMKYGERGYRHILAETGFLGQNFYLVSGALGLGCCGIGGYIDDNINQLLDVDGVKESVVALFAVGKTK